jgi:hypothetical protein
VLKLCEISQNLPERTNTSFKKLRYYRLMENNRIFKGQTALHIMLKTFCDLEVILSAVITYLTPDGSIGEFAAGVADMAKGVIFHECIKGDITMTGWWSFWAFITFADGRTAAGEAAEVFIWAEGAG